MKRKDWIAALSSVALALGMAAGATVAMANETPPDGVSTVTNEFFEAGAPIKVKLERTDKISEPGSGDTLKWALTYENLTDQALTVFPRTSNLGDTAVNGEGKNCRWHNLGAKQTAKCEFPQHVVTLEEAARGEFIPQVTFDATRDREGKDVIRAGMKVQGPAIRLKEPITFTLTPTHNLSGDLMVNDQVTYELSYQNNTKNQLTVFPRSSNLNGTAVQGNSGGCRWHNLQAGTKQKCSTPSRVIDAEIAKTGTFTPEVTIDITSDRNGNTVLARGIRVTGPTVNVVNKVRPDISEVPTDRAEGESVRLASAGKGGFTCYRIPALTTAPNGWILASWDGRPWHCGDAPQPNSIVQRISKDGGRSWGPAHNILAGSTAVPGYRGKQFGYSDPSYVTDRETGDIFLFAVKSFDQGIAGSTTGVDPTNRRVIHAAVSKSSDNGVTWSEPKVITADITKDVGAVKGRFAASGEGIQLRYGPHKGRLLQQFTFWMSKGEPKAVTVYSDDHGTTWKAGNLFGWGMDENKVVELSNGDVMDNSRDYGWSHGRKISISKDGGITYGDTWIDYNLVDARNNASIIRAFPDAAQGTPEAQVLLFSNANSSRKREKGTVHLSFDDGRTWPVAKVFREGDTSYSTLTPLPERAKYGLLFEPGGENIDYTQISLDWVGYHAVVPQIVQRDVYRGGNVVTLRAQNTTGQTVEGAKLVLPNGSLYTWEEGEISLPALAPGQIAEVKAKVNVSAASPDQQLRLPIEAKVGDKVVKGTGLLKVISREGETAPEKVSGVGLQDGAHVPAQKNQEADKMLDGDPNTLWHSPWNSKVQLPLDIDFSMPFNPRIIAADFKPRKAGLNGIPSDIDFFYVHDNQEIKIGHGDLSKSNFVPLTLPSNLEAFGHQNTMLIRVRINHTLGENGQNDYWASLAEVEFRERTSDEPLYDEPLASPQQSKVEIKFADLETSTPAEASDENASGLDSTETEAVYGVGTYNLRLQLRDLNAKPIAGQKDNLKIEVQKKQQRSRRSVRSVASEEPANETTPGAATSAAPLTEGVDPSVELSEIVENPEKSGEYTAKLKFSQPGEFIVKVFHNGDEIGESPVQIKSSIASLKAVAVNTEFGVAPVLPAQVTAVYDDAERTEKQVNVNWNAVEAGSYSVKEGATFKVEGTVEGTTLKAEATVTQAAKPLTGEDCLAEGKALLEGSCQVCPQGQQPASDGASCVAKPPTAEECKADDGKVLIGDTCQACPEGKEPNSEHTGCVDKPTPPLVEPEPEPEPVPGIDEVPEPVQPSPEQCKVEGMVFVDGRCQPCADNEAPNADYTGCIGLVVPAEPDSEVEVPLVNTNDQGVQVGTSEPGTEQGSQTEPTNTAEQGSQAGVETSEQGAQVKPDTSDQGSQAGVETSDQGSQAGVETSEQGAQVKPDTSDQGSQAGVETSEQGSQAGVETSEQGIQTKPETAENGTQTEPGQTVDSGMQTEPNTTESGTQTKPSQTTESGVQTETPAQPEVNETETDEPEVPLVAPNMDLVDADGGAVLESVAGGKLHVHLSGWEAGTKVEFYLHSDPVFLGDGVVDTEGSLNKELHIPEDTTVGDHHVEARTATYSKKVALKVNAPEVKDPEVKEPEAKQPEKSEPAGEVEPAPVAPSTESKGTQTEDQAVGTDVDKDAGKDTGKVEPAKSVADKSTQTEPQVITPPAEGGKAKPETGNVGRNVQAEAPQAAVKSGKAKLSNTGAYAGLALLGAVALFLAGGVLVNARRRRG